MLRDRPAVQAAHRAALDATGYTGIQKTSAGYATDLSFDQVTGGLYLAMPSHVLPPPDRRAAFTGHIRNAIGPSPRFTEQADVAALIGRTPS